MKASSLFSIVSIPPPEVFSFKAKVVAEFSKEIFRPPSCSLFNRFLTNFRGLLDENADEAFNHAFP